MRRLIPFACLLLPLTIAAQTPPSTSKAEAKANASANSSDSKSKKSSSSQTVTHKVVVKNGKTIVDEKTVNGKPVKGGKGRAGKGLGLGGMPSMDTDAIMRDMMKDLRKQLGKDMEGITIRPPLRVTGGKLTPEAQEKLMRDLMREVGTAKTGENKKTSGKKSSTTKKAKTERGKLVPRTRKAGKTPPIVR